MFQPPLSQGLLWCKVYIYNKSNSHKIVTNLAQKYDSVFLHQRKIVLRFSASYYDVSRVESPKTWSKIVLRCNPIVLQCDRFQSYNFESLSQQSCPRRMFLASSYCTMTKGSGKIVYNKEQIIHSHNIKEKARVNSNFSCNVYMQNGCCQRGDIMFIDLTPKLFLYKGYTYHTHLITLM